MILILSEEKDLTTNEVTDWFDFFGIDYIRLNENESNELIYLDIITGEFEIKTSNNEIISSKLVTCVWYRRGRFLIKRINFELKNKRLEENIERYLKTELFYIEDMLHFLIINNIPFINSYFDNRINKLEVLATAYRCGLKIPGSIIVNRKQRIQDYSNQSDIKNFITKSVKNGLSYLDDKIRIEEYTTNLELNNLLPDNFFYSLVQERISKKIEIRSFFLFGEFYSSAIFSQKNEDTEVDVRKPTSKFNRVVPFKLPDSVENKINKLMNCLKLKSGSIDLIYSTDNEFVFLEVNPIGQFAQVSYPCNYYLEEKLALKLSEIQIK